MIDKGYLTAKMKEISEMKGQKITREAIDFLYRHIEAREPEDLDRAVRDILWEEEKFVPVKLKRAIDKYAMARQTAAWEEKKMQEAREAKTFCNPEEVSECRREACRGCPNLSHCRLRAVQWIKGIAWVLKREEDGRPLRKGEGQERAEQIIRFMMKEFMGGIA